MQTVSDIGHTEGSGNVFADLGLAEPDELLIKAELARAISTIIAERGLTQVQAADLLGLDQLSLSALTRGRLGEFSVDQMLRFLLALGHDVDIVIKSGAHPAGRVSVVAAR